MYRVEIWENAQMHREFREHDIGNNHLKIVIMHIIDNTFSYQIIYVWNMISDLNIHVQLKILVKSSSSYNI